MGQTCSPRLEKYLSEVLQFDPAEVPPVSQTELSPDETNFILRRLFLERDLVFKIKAPPAMNTARAVEVLDVKL